VSRIQCPCFSLTILSSLLFSVSLAFSCLTFLTTIWGESVAFIWLLNVTGISSLLVWISIGFISLRFRQAYKVQGLSLSDLPYRHPFYPLLPIVVLVLGTLMFIALGYASARQEPFNPRVNAIFYITNDFRTHAKLFSRTWLQLTLALPCMPFYFLDI
jgi:amino acid permease